MSNDPKESTTKYETTIDGVFVPKVSVVHSKNCSRILNTILNFSKQNYEAIEVFSSCFGVY
jgi:hypothetical protein